MHMKRREDVNEDVNIAIIATSFHKETMEGMIKDARKTAKEEGIHIVKEVWVPGCYEIPLTLKRLFAANDIDGAVALGIIERGETKHGMVMAIVVHDAIMKLELETGKPVGLGILGPEILLKQAPSRGKLYSRKAVLALKAMLEMQNPILASKGETFRA